MERIRNLLTPQATTEVLKIVISPGEQEDNQIWPPEKDGKFSVKSAYRLFKEIGKERQEGESSNVERHKEGDLEYADLKQGESLCLESMQKWAVNKAQLEEEESNNRV